MASKKRKHILPAMTVMLLMFTFNSCNKSEHYSFTIIDDVSGEQLASRVSVSDQYGRSLDIDGNPTNVEYLGKHWCYTDGEFSITVPGKGGTIEVQHGPETLPVRLSLLKESR